MVIESRTVIGAGGALVIVGAVLWFSVSLSTRPAQHAGTVEVQQVHERSWAVEVKDLGASPAATTAANR